MSEIFSGDLFHIRSNYSPDDDTVVYAPYFASEIPAPENFMALDGLTSRLLHQRHIAKRAVDLNGVPVLAHYPLDMTINAPAEVIEAREAAAQEVIDHWLNADFLNMFASKIDGRVRQDETVTFLHRTSITGSSERHNYLFTRYEEVIINALQERLSHRRLTFEALTVPVATVPKRTESNPLERVVRQPYIDPENQFAIMGKRIILLDDHVQAGGTFATFHALAKELGDGTEVIGMTALSVHPTGTDLHVYDQVKNALHLAWEKNGRQDSIDNVGPDDVLGKVGLSVDTLTNREALYLIGMFTDGHDAQAIREYFDLVEDVSHGVAVPDGRQDTFDLLVQSPPIAISDLKQSIDRLIKERSTEIKARLASSSNSEK